MIVVSPAYKICVIVGKEIPPNHYMRVYLILFIPLQFLTPSPMAYQTDRTEARVFTKSFKPFNVASDRFQVFKRDLTEVMPG